jgi:hypothetical protein
LKSFGVENVFPQAHFVGFGKYAPQLESLNIMKLSFPFFREQRLVQQENKQKTEL